MNQTVERSAHNLARRNANAERSSAYERWTMFIGHDEHGVPYHDSTLNTRLSASDMNIFTPGFVHPPLFIGRGW